MNQRLQELMNQANQKYSDIVGEPGIYYYSRFAEILSDLIIEDVREVLSHCYQQLPLEHAAHILWAEEEILDHFYGNKNG